MPSTDPGYLTGVIREKEKLLLSDDAYTRMIGSPGGEEAVRMLADTPYGAKLDGQFSLESALQALTNQAGEELAWLLDGLDSLPVKLFLTARYDALNIAHSLTAFAQGQESPRHLSPLGLLSQDLLFSIIWRDAGWESVPVVWVEILRHERLAVTQDGWSISALMDRMTTHTLEVLQQIGRSPLARAVTALSAARATADRFVRLLQPNESRFGDIGTLPISAQTPLAQVTSALQAAGVTHMTDTILEEVRAGRGAVAYERAFDEALISLLRAHRLEVSGYDPIIAYWLSKEMERKTLRMVLSAKFSGVDAVVLKELVRPLAHYSYL